MLSTINDFLIRRKPFGLVMLGALLVIVLGYLDFASGYELSFSFFYLLPVSIESWYVGRRIGLLTALICAIVWLQADLASERKYNLLFAPYWNAATRMGFFSIVAILLAKLKQVYEHERTLARTDFLTGVSNSRYFMEVAEMELSRSERYHRPLSLVFIDLDNFKSVNDRFGHAMGDRLLQTVCQIMQNTMRKSDLIARMGGDEFVILLPETGDEEAQTAVKRMQDCLQKEMSRNNWSVTCSIGLVIYYTLPKSFEEMLKKADDLAYASKEGGKNRVTFEVIGTKVGDEITKPTRRKING